jgi:hypothetical protein
LRLPSVGYRLPNRFPIASNKDQKKNLSATVAGLQNRGDVTLESTANIFLYSSVIRLAKLKGSAAGKVKEFSPIK